jgi:hypothetical protein
MCVTIFPDCLARSRHRAEACAAAHRSVGRVRKPAEGMENRPKQRHRQLFLGLFKIIGVYHSRGGGDAAARDSSEVSRRSLPLVDTPEGGGEVDRVALALNSSTSSSSPKISQELKKRFFYKKFSHHLVSLRIADHQNHFHRA